MKLLESFVGFFALIATVLNPTHGVTKVCEGPYPEMTCTIDQLNPSTSNLTFLRQLSSGAWLIKLTNLEASTLDQRLLKYIVKPVERMEIIDARTLQRILLPASFTIERLIIIKTSLSRIQIQENETIVSLIIMSSNLWKLPPSFRNLRNVTFIKIQLSYIQYLNLDLLQWCQRLEALDLKYNKIRTVTSSLGGPGRRKLSALFLSHNQLKMLNLEVLPPLGWFSLLDLSHNVLEGLVGRFVSEELSSLLLPNNHLTALDFCQWQPIPSLTSMSFESNNLTRTPNCMHHFPSLTYVSFAGNKITTLHVDVFATLHNLTLLDYSSNQISLIVFRQQQHPPRLAELILKDNQIDCKHLQPVVPFCTLDIDFQTNSPTTNEYVRWLDIKSSMLSIMPPSLANLKNLTTIKIQRSYIKHLNLDLLQAYDNLDELDLSHNKIITITSSPHAVQRHSLSVLTLNYNKLKILNLETLPPLGWFEFLFITHNALELVVGRFASNKLRGIYLMDNRLKALDFCQWQPIPSLAELTVRSNYLIRVPHCMHNLPNLRVVNFINNSFTEIDLDPFAAIDKLSALHLSYNRISKIILHEDRFPKALRELILTNNKVECSNPPDILFCPLDIELQTNAPDGIGKRHNIRAQLNITLE
uniref:Uncharacterized protein n=1 Tax=Anopheles farauti TaxID=69004 RepID=A0A182QZR0_9DIPT